MDHRKKYKRALYLALLFLMLAARKLPGQEISCVAAQEQGQAVTLSESSLLMTRGRTHRLKLEGADETVRWKSSHPSVASVNSSGRIKAKKSGTCVITAKYRQQAYRCRVRVYARSAQWRPQAILRMYRPKKDKGKVILAGSSYIERWEDAQETLAPLEVLNMGIAGSKADDWLKLYQTLIVPYRPKAIVLCAGDNNMHGSRGSESGASTAAKVTRLLQNLQKELPKTKIFYVSVAPNPRCWHVWDEASECNRRVEAYCRSKKNLHFIDVAPQLLNEGKLQKSLYCADRLHLNRSGYEIWGRTIVRKLKKEKTLLR